MTVGLDTLRSVDTLRRMQDVLTRVLVGIGIVAMAFTATNVTLFAIDHGITPWIAWLLDPMVGAALGTVLIADGVLAGYGVRPGGWASALRWFAGLATWFMNCWSSLWPDGTPFGVPSNVHPAGLLLHSVPPVLLILLAEAITVYRRAILDRITAIERGDGVRRNTPVQDRYAEVFPPVSPTPIEAPAPAASSLVICGEHLGIPTVPPRPKLGTEAAREAIEQAWRDGLSVREAARVSTRSTTQVQRLYSALSREHDLPPGQLAIEGAAA